jgi:hypothetical protein
MKFEIVTYRNPKYLGQPGEGAWVAACRSFWWADHEPSIQVLGPTPEEARKRLVGVIQQRINVYFPELESSEVNVEMDDFGKKIWREQCYPVPDSSDLKVRVVAYEGLIIIEPIEPEKNVGKDFGWIPMGQTRIGSVLCDTKKYLGISKEAFELMKKIQVGRDCIGDLDWFACNDGTTAFSWYGPIYRVINPETAIAARGFVTDKLLETCTLISNDVPAEAVELIDRRGRSVVIWKDQAGINLPEETP